MMGSQESGYAPDASLPDTSLVDRSASAYEGDGSVHVVQFYEDDAFLVETISRLIGNALRAGDATVVIATGSRRDDLEERIRARDLDLEALREQGRYVSLDAGETLSKFMVDEWPDANRFTDVIGGVIGRAAEKSPRGRVRAFGEMVALDFRRDGKGLPSASRSSGIVLPGQPPCLSAVFIR
jgi:hypothetical protein